MQPGHFTLKRSLVAFSKALKQSNILTQTRSNQNNSIQINHHIKKPKKIDYHPIQFPNFHLNHQIINLFKKKIKKLFFQMSNKRSSNFI